MNDLSVRILQSPLHWENPAANREQFAAQLAAMQPGFDLVVLPEMFTTGFSMQPARVAEAANSETLTWMQQQAATHHTAITGSVAVHENGKYFNRLYWVNADGTFLHYDKRHLFRMAGEDEAYTGGTTNITPEIKGWRIRPLICYDLRFPVWSRNRWNKTTLQADYDVLLYVANWPERRNHPWQSLLTARAIENQAYVIGCNRTGEDGNGITYIGNSAIIDFKGEDLARLEPGATGVLSATLNYEALAEFRKAFPAGLDADSFEVIM
jgi:predicted amidohydrolase